MGLIAEGTWATWEDGNFWGFQVDGESMVSAGTRQKSQSEALQQEASPICSQYPPG